MRIGIIGTGNMGSAIGIRLSQLGHELSFGARRLERAQHAVRRAGGGARAGSNDEAAAFGEILLWTAREANPGTVGVDADNLGGRILIDVNNCFFQEADSWFAEGSFAERLNREVEPAGAVVVKALNTIARESFDNDTATLRSSGAQTFIAGADEVSRSIVSGLVGELGFKAIDLGGGPMAYRAAEALGNVILPLMARHGMQAQLALGFLPAPALGAIGDRVDSSYLPPTHVPLNSLNAVPENGTGGRTS